jgi:hypothetical protein
MDSVDLLLGPARGTFRHNPTNRRNLEAGPAGFPATAIPSKASPGSGVLSERTVAAQECLCG